MELFDFNDYLHYYILYEPWIVLEFYPGYM